jgi:small subunit ribosomal protein S2
LSQEVTVKQLLEAGVHFGHYTNKWNPKMARYIYTDRNRVYIIDLEQTLSYLKRACEYVAELAEKGGTILFVGTKRQAQQSILEAAQKSEMPYVNQRWLGGMLTNFETVRKSVARLNELEKMEEQGQYSFFTKKEVLGLKIKREKLLKVLVGVRHMKKLPDAIFVIDPKQEEIAVREARRLGIKVVSVIDTNCDPDVVDYPVPGNDDAIRAVKLICEVIGSAVEDGYGRWKQIRKDKQVAEEEAKQAAEKEAEAVSEAEKPAEKVAVVVKRSRAKKETKEKV